MDAEIHGYMEKMGGKQLSATEFEVPCKDCKETLIITFGDFLHIVVGDNSEVVGILCARCFRKRHPLPDRKDARRKKKKERRRKKGK